MEISELSLNNSTRIITLKVGMSAVERETHLNYYPERDIWYVYSSYIPQVKRVLEISNEVLTVEVYRGRIVGVSAMLKPEQIRLYR